MINIKYLPIFAKKLKELAKKNPNIKKDYQKLLDTLQENPTGAINIKDNVYKIRVQNSSSNKGKSAGYRVYYFYKTENNFIALLYIYSKSSLLNLRDDVLDELIQECKIIFKDELDL